MAKGVEFCDYAEVNLLARQISNLYVTWQGYRQTWLDETAETRNYLFATSTKTTSVNKLRWKNSVHIPKLCQIRDNLYANYMAALFPNDRSIAWEGDDDSSQTKEKREVIQAYMQNKLRTSGFAVELSKCVLDYIDYGNCFAAISYKNEEIVDPNGPTSDGQPQTHQGYVGPQLVHISPYDIVFDPTDRKFEDTPKIIRRLITMSELMNEMNENPEAGYLNEVLKKSMNLRSQYAGGVPGDVRKNSDFQIDGFSSFMNYMQSQYVELLDFYGDIYDSTTQTFHKAKVITVVDRCYVIRNETQNSWLGKAPFFHAGWRQRPNNLYAMGPLDNLVGLQYRIDHLENAKADGIDMIIHPVLKIKGMVEDFVYGPNQRIYTSEEGDVDFMHPDASILQLDTQISNYMNLMEEMAGAPKQAAGFRTPGEKTAFEVQILDQAANKIFINKTSYFEEVFLEPALNAMLESARRNIGSNETIRVEDQDFNFVGFLEITQEDIVARGKIRPIGARRFARNANLLQAMVQFSSSPMGQDPAIMVHFSGKKQAKLVESLLNLEQFDLVEDNIRVIESIETQQMQSDGQQVLQQKGAQPNQIPGAPPQSQGSAPKQGPQVPGGLGQ